MMFQYLHSIYAVQVSITSEGNPTLGQQYSLTCEVSVSSGDTGTLTVQWMRPGSSEPITNGGDFTVTSTSATVYMLVINPLRQFHAGQYTCVASVGGDTGTDSVIVNIAGTYMTVAMSKPASNFCAVIQFNNMAYCKISIALRENPRMSNSNLQSDVVATIYFAAYFVWLLFKGSVYFFGKHGDINNSWIRYVRVRR